MKQIIIFLFVLMVITGCGNDNKKFWYPVALKEVTCSSWKGEVYLMTNTIIWRSWPYYIDIKDNREIELGTDCVMKVIRKLPEHNRNEIIETLLTDEQRQFIREE